MRRIDKKIGITHTPARRTLVNNSSSASSNDMAVLDVHKKKGEGRDFNKRADFFFFFFKLVRTPQNTFVDSTLLRAARTL